MQVGYYQHEVELYSFDSSGKIVQYIMRMYNSYFLQEGFDCRSYIDGFTEEEWNYVFFDEVDKVIYIDELKMYNYEYLLYGEESEESTPKEKLLYDLRRHGQHEGYYFSKP